MPWQVLYLRPRLEKKTAEACARGGIEHYLPLRTRTRVYQRRQVTTSLPLFPGYLFVNADEAGRLALQKTNHVLRFLVPGRPRRMLRQLVQVRRALRADPTLAAVKPLAVGRRVRIMAGPFQGLEGLVTRLSSTMRVVLTVEMIGQAIAVQAERTQVEPL
jgi:transcription antitermination factor NusG